MAMRLVDLLHVDTETRSQTYYASLLTYSGCTTDASESARIFGQSLTINVTPVEHGSRGAGLAGVVRALPPPGTSPLRRPYEVARRLPLAARFRKPHYAALCEVAAMLAERLGLPGAISSLFVFLTERWDGEGVLGRAEGDAIPLPIRVVHVARDAAYQRLLGGDDHAARIVRDRAGHAFDPEIANRLADRAPEIMAEADAPGSVWEAVLAAEPRPWPTLQPPEVDRALAAIGNFADLVSPSLSGHSQGVADLADNAARVAGFDEAEARLARRAAHVHDLGRVAAHPRIWDKTGRLTADEWEQVRLHAYQTERVLSPSPALAHLGAIAGAHHERLDGSGYHRGVSGGVLAQWSAWSPPPTPFTP
jgi:HD-GYP domain-containing protein (c-di-GMP phosphodiesterase class II)